MSVDELSFPEADAHISSPEETSNVKVAARCRPLSSQEIAQGHKSIVQIDSDDGTVTVVSTSSKNEPAKSFAFDSIFAAESSQAVVYNTVARPIVENVLKGYNGTIFAYGQTGTGKTYTMVGGLDAEAECGIIPNAFAHIFDHISRCQAAKTFLVRVSYMELYNEDIRDLLQKPRNQQRSLEVKERPDIGVHVPGLTNVVVANADQCFRIMEFGNTNRHTGSTAMNEQSSRSHAIFTLTIECSEEVVAVASSSASVDNNVVPAARTLITQGKLHLVDLAGSERQSKTQSVGERLREASRINLSLSTLGNVISALVDPKATHVPYRNSKLTRLLHDSLGGNSKTLMIATIGPASYNYEETISTLRYATRAKNIKNVVHINEDPKDALLRKFQREIELLKQQLDEIAVETTASDANDASTSSDEESAAVVVKVTERAARRKSLSRQNSRNASDERSRLQEEQGLQDAARGSLADHVSRLKEREAELEQSRKAREKLLAKLSAIERKLIVGGENMLEKAEAQARLLEQNNRELEEAKRLELALHERLQSQQAERQDIQVRYSGLQEESQGLTKQLRRVWAQNQQMRAELRDTQAEHQRETEALLENIRLLQKESLFFSLVIDQFVPPSQLKFIEEKCHWSEETAEWQLKCIAYTGNNMRRPDYRPGSRSRAKFDKEQQLTDAQQPPIYLSYADLLLDSAGSLNSAAAAGGLTNRETSSAVSNHSQQSRNFRPKSASRERNAARIRALLE